MNEDVEIIGEEFPDEIVVKEIINIEYLPKNKSPINNMFLVAPLFSPCSRNLKPEDKYREVKVVDQFGYSVEIKGVRLNMSVDFPIWSHIIKLVMENQTNKIQMSYIDFAKILGYNRKNLGSALKNRIKESLIRLRSQVIATDEIDDDDDDEIMGLLDNGTIKKKSQEVIVVVNKKIIDLYKSDRFKLIDLGFYNDLDNEITKALFLYYENHGNTVYPIKLSQIKSRMILVTKNEKEINRQIKNAHENLVKAKYLLDYEYINTKKDKSVKITKK